jgi:hypothetical protein
MSAEQNVDTIKNLYEAFGRGDVQTIMDNLTDDVDWSADVAGSVAPWHGRKEGKAAVPSFFEGIANSTTVLEFTPLAYAATDNEVLTFVRYRVRGNDTGREGEMNIHHYWRLRDGKVEYYRGSEDSALTREVLGV